MTTNENHRHRIACPVWHRPYLFVGKDSVGAKCSSCKDIHSISRETLEKLWDSIDEDGDSSLEVTVFGEKR
mgnify:CR=1